MEKQENIKNKILNTLYRIFEIENMIKIEKKNLEVLKESNINDSCIDDDKIIKNKIKDLKLKYVGYVNNIRAIKYEIKDLHIKNTNLSVEHNTTDKDQEYRSNLQKNIITNVGIISDKKKLLKDYMLNKNNLQNEIDNLKYSIKSNTKSDINLDIYKVKIKEYKENIKVLEKARRALYNKIVVMVYSLMNNGEI